MHTDSVVSRKATVNMSAEIHMINMAGRNLSRMFSVPAEITKIIRLRGLVGDLRVNALCNDRNSWF